MEKSGSQKALKVLSIIMIVLSILGVLMSLGVIAGGALFGAASTMSDATADESAMMVTGGLLLGGAGIVLLVSYVIDLIIGILGLRGANNPAKIGAFYVLTIIGIVVNAIICVLAIAGGTDASSILGNIVSLVIVIVLFVLARNIKNQVA